MPLKVGKILNKKIGFVSLGCAKNQTDTETMLALVSDRGFEITNDEADADVIVVNTCAFIDSAKEESISAILEMAQYKEDKCSLLIVTGCMAQRYKDEIIKELPEVDIILGVNDYNLIADTIISYFENGGKNSCVSDANAHITTDLPRVLSTPSHTAYLKIADGCDNFCTYCIIPKLRGKYKSRNPESIVNEAKSLAKSGVKELILVAQDTAYYGREKGCDYSLVKLLKDISAIDGIEWIRLQYCYPENITDELIDEIASNKKIVKYLDMPLQHVSDNVLKKMGRRSRKEEIYSLVAKLRERIENLSVRTSIIVGFPGETEEDFKELYEFLKTARLEKVGVFTYSREEDTPAYSFDDQIDEVVKEERYDALMSLQSEISLSINESKIGSITEAIVEDYDEAELSYVGRTYADTIDVDGNAYIYSADELEIGSRVKIKILNAENYDVIGEVVN